MSLKYSYYVNFGNYQSSVTAFAVPPPLPKEAFARSETDEVEGEMLTVIPPLRYDPPQKHGRLARLGRFAILPVSSLAHLAVSAAGGASVCSPLKVKAS